MTASATPPHDAADRIAARLEALAFARASGTAGNARAQDLLAAWLTDAGLTVERRAFRYSLTRSLAVLRGTLAGVAAPLVFAAAIQFLGVTRAWTVPVFAALVALPLIVAWRLVRDDRVFFAEPCEITAANLISQIGADDSARRVVLVAHYDSKGQRPAFLVRAGIVALGLAGVVAAVGGTVLAAAVGWTSAIVGVLIAAGAIAWLSLSRLTFDDRSPGALDNAASVVAVVEAAGRLAADPPARGTVAIVLTGAEEHLMVGARALLRDAAAAWDRTATRIVNLDGIGVRGAVGVTGPRALRGWVRAVARAGGVAVRAIRLPVGTGTDALPLARAGFATVTLTSSRLGKAVFAIHTPRDLPENVDAGAIRDAATIVERLARDWCSAP